MPQTSILVQLDSAVQARLAALADDRRQPVSDVAAEVISMYFAPDSWNTSTFAPAWLSWKRARASPMNA